MRGFRNGFEFAVSAAREQFFRGDSPRLAAFGKLGEHSIAVLHGTVSDPRTPTKPGERGLLVVREAPTEQVVADRVPFKSALRGGDYTTAQLWLSRTGSHKLHNEALVVHGPTRFPEGILNLNGVKVDFQSVDHYTLEGGPAKLGATEHFTPQDVSPELARYLTTGVMPDPTEQHREFWPEIFAPTPAPAPASVQ